MALVLKDRVKESSTTSGTGTITLGGAFVGFQTFASAVASGSTVYYTIHNTTAGNDGEWEVGVGTFTSPDQLSRDTVLSSSAGGTTKVAFTGSSLLEVFITQPAEEAVYINQATGKVEAFGNGTNTISFTEINTTNLTANTVTLTAGTISTNASNATDITNKTYVDGLFSTGISYHNPVNYEVPASQGNLVAVYNQPNGAGNGVGATLTNNGANAAFVADGITVSTTNRILIYNQTNQFENGIYEVTNVGAPDSPGPGSKWVLTRTTDTDTYGLADPDALGQGDGFYVLGGNSGKGETYICNTQGTITFGTTDITFAQISSSQVYSAGTGLTLANLTFSISNTAVTAATYGNDGNVAQVTVNAQGQLTNASNVAINASSITTGTLPNAQTTANSANGASTIVLRDTNGSFAANVVNATDVNSTNVSATTGAFTNVSGNGALLTAINASNISSGTIANARTTGNASNSASTLVLRDLDGSFGSNVITASLFSGDGSGINAINASNISSGTIANARTTAASANGASTIVLRDAGGNFSANMITADITGSGAALTNINASNISSGTIANARTTGATANGASTLVLRGASGEFAAGTITGAYFVGDGSNVSAINASNISSGTIANARTTASSANGASTIVARDAGGNFSANTVTAAVIGDLSGGSAINASNISSGTIANARTTAASANGASTIVARDASGNFTANAGTFTSVSGDGSALSAINASNISSGTIANARTTAASANGASTIVARDANGSFAGNVITATTFTGVNASAITTGTLGAQYGGTGSANLTANNVILGNGAGAVQVVAPGTNGNVLTSNGTTWTSAAAGGGFDAGTRLIFAQTSAPTGWTKDTVNYNNHALRVVTGAASTGGTVDFTTAFASQTPAGTVSISAVSGSAGATTLSTPQIPSHSHSIPVGGGQYTLSAAIGTPAKDQPGNTGNAGGGGSHTHPFSFTSGTASFSGTAINLAVKYLDVITATKN